MAKKINAKDFLNDIRSGMDDDALMRKYEISDQGLQRLLKQLLEKGLLTESDLSSRSPKATEAVVDTSLSRQEPSEPVSPQVTPEKSKSEDITLQNLFGDWWESKKALILLLIFATPIGLYGLYKTSIWPKKTKIAIAVLTVVLAIAAIKPALRLWLIGIAGIGAYALYQLLPFGRAARIAISVVAGMMVVGMIAPFIDKDSEKKKAVPVQTTETAQPAPQPVQPKPAPVVQPAPAPMKVAQAAPPPKAETKEKPKAKATPDGKPISDITFSQVRSNFIDTDSDLTKAQKPREWASNYKGKWVRWDGYVTEVREGWGGGISLNVDMLTGSLTGIDLIFSVKKDQQEKALKLKKNQKIVFVGRMDSEPGSLMPMSLEDVIIE
jgi:hypothetical protein